MNPPPDKKPAGPQQDTPPWNPDHASVFVGRDATTERVTLLRHDGYPYYPASWDSTTGLKGLFKIANLYLAAANKHLQLPQAWLDDLTHLGNPAVQTTEGMPPLTQLRWFHGRADRLDSYWVKRRSGLDKKSATVVLDRSAVLLAGLCWRWEDQVRLRGGQGLRIIAQVSPAPQGGIQARITGVSSTLPYWPHHGAPAHSGEQPARAFIDLLRKAAKSIPALFGLSDEEAVIEEGYGAPDAHQEVDRSWIYFAKTAASSEDEYAGRGSGPSYRLVARWDEETAQFVPLAKRALMTFADADVYLHDPVSKNGAKDFIKFRPSRSWTVLDPARDPRQPLGTLPAGTTAANMAKLETADFRVTNARLVDPPLPENDTKEVPDAQPLDPNVPHVRTNRFAAANSYYHTSELFARMRLYGLAPEAYFRFVDRPIIVRYRSGIFPGAGDGRTVNAQVRWTLRPNGGGKGAIEVCFALGDLQSAVGRMPAKLPASVGPERSPLGVASDPRWCWHEYCHVLLTAAVGDLEFRFAHSAGDAMAAILCDPDSMLTNDENGVLANGGPWRGVTFPWVFIPRRHDRDVHSGWGWTGPMNSRDRYFSVPGMSDKRGYWTEQILSSSLFRLYRAIGGDSQQTGNQTKDPVARNDAANYAVYLIMRAIKSLGAASVTPSTTPNDFVDAMRKADTATATAPGPGGYVGGTVHKVIQWAFERQGLYGLPVPGSPVIGPEERATVDLHIDDQRAKRDGPYSPVDLNVHGTAWHANSNAMWVSDSWFSRKKKIHVCVQNRGVDKAPNTRVDVWYAKLNDGVIPPVVPPVIPPFPGATWHQLPSQTLTVPGRSNQTPGEKEFGPFKFTPDAGPQEYAILAAASCAADLSNIDPATGHPCVTVPSPIQFLVACDNNLGLIKIATA